MSEHDEDPWAKAHMDPRPWCEVCEGDHDDHAAWLAERAAAVAGWSESAEALEAALSESRLVLRRMGVHQIGAGSDADDADGLYKEIARLVADLRRITDAAAWRSEREASEAAEHALAEALDGTGERAS